MTSEEQSDYSETYSQVSHGAVKEALAGLRDQIGQLKGARKDIKRIVQKQEAQQQVLGMPLLPLDKSRVGSERDLSEMIDEADA